MTMRNRLTRGLLLAALVLPLLAMGVAPASGQAPPPASTITVVHGLRGQLVDVYLDDSLVLKGYAPERVTDPIPIATGNHRVTLRPAESPGSAAPMVSGVVKITPGANVSVVAHFDQNGKPAISSFGNDVDALPNGKARLVARNTAAVAPVDVEVAGLPTVSALAPNQQFGTDVAPATYQVTVRDGSGATIVPPNDVPVPEGTSTIMYLIGTRADNNLIWIGQSIRGLAATPTAVKTGNSGLAAPRSGDVPASAWWLVVLGVAAVGAGCAPAVLRRR